MMLYYGSAEVDEEVSSMVHRSHVLAGVAGDDGRHQRLAGEDQGEKIFYPTVENIVCRMNG